MKTLTLEEINDIANEIAVTRGVSERREAVHKLLTEISQPSISAEEFLKEKGLYETTHDNLLCIGNKLVSLEDVKSLITDFASRQGKVVEPINDKGDKCSGCGHYFTDKYNFCPNCGSKIVWK